MRDRIEFPCGCVYSRFSGLPEVVTCRCRGLRCRPRRLADAALRIREVLQAPPPEGYTAEGQAFKVVSDFLDGFYAHPDAG